MSKWLLPGNEFLLAQLLVAADVDLGDDLSRACLRFTITLAISFTDQIVLKVANDANSP